MKIPAPCMTGIENVLDFGAARAKASPELRALSTEHASGSLTAMLAQRNRERLSPDEIQRIEAERERQIIAGAIVRLVKYTSKSAVVDFLEDALATLGGK